VADFDFPSTPAGTVGELWRAILRVLPSIGRRQKVLRTVSIGTTETPVAHGLGYVPDSASLILNANATWWQTRSPDAKCVYFAASTAITADVVVLP
jgi:hypothetical protein